jgi:hypothetical protein
MRAAIGAAFGTRAKPYPDDLAAGVVAEHLWSLIVRVHPESPLVHLHGPKFYATAPGADGLAIHRNGGYFYRLWEVKKHDGDNLTATVRNAYGQINTRALSYLLEIAAVGQLQGGPMGRFYATLAKSWQKGSPAAKAGVSVATSVPPKVCFGGMRKSLGHLSGADSCFGLIIALGNLSAFTARVRQLAWTGL